MSDMEIRVEPKWSLLTTFSVNLLSLPTHQHGPRGPHYLTHDQAVNMLHACIKAMDTAPSKEEANLETLCDARAPGSGDRCVKRVHPEEPDNHDGRYWLYENGVRNGRPV